MIYLAKLINQLDQPQYYKLLLVVLHAFFTLTALVYQDTWGQPFHTQGTYLSHRDAHTSEKVHISCTHDGEKSERQY